MYCTCKYVLDKLTDLSVSLSPCMPHTVTLHSQPLLCISLLALLLLPLSLSCDRKKPPIEVRNDYMAIVQTDLDTAVSKAPILFIYIFIFYDATHKSTRLLLSSSKKQALQLKGLIPSNVERMHRSLWAQDGLTAQCVVDFNSFNLFSG